MNDIARNIKKLRQKRGLTQEELGEKLHVTRQAVSNWETGKNQPDVEMLKSMAEVLEADIKELLYGPTPDEKRRKLVVALILCLLAGGVWLVFALLYDEAKVRRQLYYDIRMATFLLLGLRPIGYLLVGAAVMALVSIWRDLRPATFRLRRGMLAGGAIILLLYVLGLLCVFGVVESHKFYSYWMIWLSRYPWSFLVPGVLFFCSTSRKAG